MRQLSNEQIHVGVEWWVRKLQRMHARTQHPTHQFSEEQVQVFASSLREKLLGRGSWNLDARIALPDELSSALDGVGAGANADLYMDGFMCFPFGGVLAHESSDISIAWVEVLLPFSGTLVWEEWLGYCGKAEVVPEASEEEESEPKMVQKRINDKVWAACLAVSCSELSSTTLQWIYYARYGKRGYSLQEGGTKRFDAHQADAVKHYRSNVRTNYKATKYVPIAFDHPFKTPFEDHADFTVASFAAYLRGNTVSLEALARTDVR